MGLGLVPLTLTSFASDWDNAANQEYPSLGEGQAQTLTYYVNTTLFNATQVRLGLRLGLG